MNFSNILSALFLCLQRMDGRLASSLFSLSQDTYQSKTEDSQCTWSSLMVENLLAITQS